jgi:WD40 repeat protein
MKSLLRFLLLLCSVTAISRVMAEPPVTALAVSPDAKHLLIGSQQGVEIQDWEDGKVVGRLATELIHVHDLRFSPDGDRLLAAGGSPSDRGEVELWHWPSRVRTRTDSQHNDVVYRVDWSPDGGSWVSGGGDGRCVVVEASTGKLLTTFEGHSRSVLSVEFLNQESILSASADQTIRMWHGVEGSQIRTLDNHVGIVNSIAVGPRKEGAMTTMLASVSEDRTIRLWQPNTGRLMRFLRLASVPRCLVWSTDGNHLYVGCNDGVIRVIEVSGLTLAKEIDGKVGRIHELVICPKRNALLVGGESGAHQIPL